MLSAFIPSTHSYPAMLLAEQLVHQRCVHPGPLVLRTAPLRYLTPAPDRDRTVSRRSEPSSRTALMGEQPNPWDRLQPQDAMSRHRGAKPSRRCGLLGKISLLSPEYLLSVERRPYHSEPPDHQNLVSHLLGLQASQSSLLMLLHSKGWLPTILSRPYVRLRYILGGDRPSQTTHLTRSSRRITVASQDARTSRVVFQG